MCDDDLEDQPVFSKHDRFDQICEKQNEMFEDYFDGVEPRETLGMRQYEDAFVGFYRVSALDGIDSGGYRAVYSFQGIIEILCKDMTLEDALEHYAFNIAGSIPDDEDIKYSNSPIYPLIIQTWTEDV